MSQNTISFSFTHIIASSIKPGQWLQFRPFENPVKVTRCTLSSTIEIEYLSREGESTIELSLDEMIKLVGQRYEVEIDKRFLSVAQLVEMLNMGGGVLTCENDISPDQHGTYLNSPVSAPGLATLHDVISESLLAIRENKLPFNFIIVDKDELVSDRIDNLSIESREGFGPSEVVGSGLRRFEFVESDADSSEMLPQVTFNVQHGSRLRNGIIHDENVRFTNTPFGWSADIHPEHNKAHPTLSSCASHLGTKLISLGIALSTEAQNMDAVDFNTLRSRIK